MGFLYHSDTNYGEYIEALRDNSEYSFSETTKKGDIYTIRVTELEYETDYHIQFTSDLILYYKMSSEYGYDEFIISDNYDTSDIDFSVYQIGYDNDHDYWFGYGW